MSSIRQKTRPWLRDTLEGHAGSALMMQGWLDEEIRPDQKMLMRERLRMSLRDLADRMDEMGLRRFDTERATVSRTATGAEVYERVLNEAL